MRQARGKRTGRANRSARAAALLVAVAVTAIPAGDLRAAPTEADLRSAEARLLEIEREFELVVEEYNAVEERLTGIHLDMAETELVVRHIQERMEAKRRSAVALAVELYKAGPTGASVEAVLSSETLAELETRAQYLRSSSDAQAEVFERLAVDRRELDGRAIKLEEQKAEALAAEAELAQLRIEVESKLQSQQQEIAELNAALERARARQAALDAAAAAQAATAGAGVVAIDFGAIEPAPAPNPEAQAAIDAALSQLGKPYQWGAEGPDSFDCSGLTMWSWAHADVAIPRTSQTQYAGTTRVPKDDWQPGDLLFFGNPIHHVSMYIGNGQMVEAPYTGSEVRVVSAYRSDYVGAGRPGV
ncbi:MAG: C40 family peptidase [Actinomycetota bacterium]|nr:C40 family peptidase [Actinomycetota bacterium]